MSVRVASACLVTVVWVVASAACQSMGAAGTPAPTTGPALASPSTALDPLSLRWVRDAAEYRAAFVQTYAVVTRRVEAESVGRTAGSWVVVLDADETVIGNFAYQLERSRAGLSYTPESWNAWVRRREATPLPGAAAFLARVRALGGRIAIVTNRLESECDDTAAVFALHQLAYDAMLCRPDGEPSDKTARFDAVAGGRTAAGGPSLEVIAFVGDNIQDFPGLMQASLADGSPAFAEFGTRFFVVPNPMYGSWQ